MLKTLFTSLFLCAAVASSRAAFFPFLDEARGLMVERQAAISNAPPITAAGKKELNTLKGALKAIDKPSTGLKSDLKTFSTVVLKVNKGASNETLNASFRSAANSYIGLLVQTNDALEVAVAEANNNPTLKEKAVAALEKAQLALAALDPEADVNGAAKGLGKVLTSYLAAGKAVQKAVNAPVTPLPAPKAGTLIVEVNGMRLTFGAQFPLRNAEGTGLVGSGEADGSSSMLVVHIPQNGGPGSYTFGLLFSDTVDGTTIEFTGSGDGTAEVTSASATVLAGTLSGTALVRINGGPQQSMPFTGRFNGKKFSFLP